jgi:hypothetical protein
MKNIVDKLNKKINEFTFLDFSIYKYENQKLVIAVSEDFTYFHQFEIEFHNVHTINCNSFFSIETESNVISIINNVEMVDLNKKYNVEVGYNIFQIISDEGKEFFIIAESISFKDNIVKYSR